MAKEINYVFGPVPSRRLRRSLGLDLVPFKTCSFDCVYCQLGRTTNLTVALRRYVPIEDVMWELLKKLDKGVEADYITLSGSGEPTLNSGVGYAIEFIKSTTTIPVAVLTNGSLLWDKRVRESLLAADVVLPSLDAGTPETFRKVNRPHAKLEFENTVEGIAEFRRVYSGAIWLEVMLVDGINSSPSEIANIKRHIEFICPDKIHLNTVVRPAAEEFARMVSPKQMLAAKEILGDRAEIIAPYAKTESARRGESVSEEILALLRRRPCTLEDICNGMGLHRAEVLKHLAALEEDGLLRKTRVDDAAFYQVVEEAKRVSDSSQSACEK